MKENTCELVNEDVKQSLTKYVWSNYNNLKNRDLIIKDCGNLFLISKHKDESPLILGKEVLV